MVISFKGVSFIVISFMGSSFVVIAFMGVSYCSFLGAKRNICTKISHLSAFFLICLQFFYRISENSDLLMALDEKLAKASSHSPRLILWGT